jgi:Xaa-Pro aminopeptidase
MRYQPLPATFHAANRARLAEAIGPEAVAIIDTADTLVRTGDFAYPFRPDSNFYYLTGLDQPEAVLVLVPGSPGDLRELLFIKETDEFTAKWEGNLHTQEEAAQRSGIKQVFWLSELPRMLDRILAKYSTIYLNAEESLESNMPSPAKRRAATLRETFPLHTLRSAVPALTRQRMVKAPEEVAQIRRAVDITRAGLLRAWAATRPGLPEYAVESELTAEFLRRGATGQAFMPIIASGRGTTVIHYMQNDATIGDHDLVLFDVGAEAGYYAADISRTIPAAGRFTPRQRALYEAVYRTQQAAIPLHKPGATIWSIDEFMREHLLEELVALKVLTAAQAKSKAKFKLLHEYYGHISHHLGLEVHDNPDFRTPLEPGMVVTCEPGLYLREEGIGVRIEDDILITDTGHEVLSQAIPSHPDELETLMNIDKNHKNAQASKAL